ncbi:hypothetical protein DVH24_008456 [Malus domestica]|uniref:Uncharacterized protein n=1 Tax=Malus domestica TaxID=3750 RepID=A0A498JLN2_MALDO|nr:hypothetical protein DVH24_008456 [Malus domestica]
MGRERIVQAGLATGGDGRWRRELIAVMRDRSGAARMATDQRDDRFAEAACSRSCSGFLVAAAFASQVMSSSPIKSSQVRKLSQVKFANQVKSSSPVTTSLVKSSLHVCQFSSACLQTHVVYRHGFLGLTISKENVPVSFALKLKLCSPPIASALDVVERVSEDILKLIIRNVLDADEQQRHVCLSIWDRFAASDEHCTPRGIQSSEKFSVSTCSSRVNGGNARGSGAEVEHFERNCKFYTALIASAIESEALFTYLALYILIVLAPWRLEKILREQIVEGQPITHRHELSITIAVSLAYVYWDEALSIGAVGKMGRDVCELLGVDTADVL